MGDTHFLWCRAWPWFRPEFPFEEFEHLDGPELSAALDAAGKRWVDEHPGALEANQRSLWPWTSRRDRAKTPPLILDWVAVLAGWVNQPQGIWVTGEDGSPFLPSKRVIFYAVDGADLASDVLAALRVQASAVSANCFGDGQAILRYGSVCTNEMEKTVRVHVARSHEEFRERKHPGWAVQVAEEAAKIERVLREEDGPLCVPDQGTRGEAQEALKAIVTAAAREAAERVAASPGRTSWKIMSDEDKTKVAMRITVPRTKSTLRGLASAMAAELSTVDHAPGAEACRQWLLGLDLASRRAIKQKHGIP